MITRLRVDAPLFDPPARRRSGIVGRPRGVGHRQPTLAARLVDNRRRWPPQARRMLEIVSGTAIWHHPGHFVPVRYGLVRNLAEELRPQTFLCTDLHADPVDILGCFVRRWSIETPSPRSGDVGGSNLAAAVRFHHRSNHTRLTWCVLFDHRMVSSTACGCSADAAGHKLVPKASPDLQRDCRRSPRIYGAATISKCPQADQTS
jgi:hypothetical protein